MAPRKHRTSPSRRPATQAERDLVQLEQQLQELERALIQLRLEEPRHNYDIHDINPMILAGHLKLLGDSLRSIGYSLEAEFEIPEPPCLPVILCRMMCALRALMRLQELIPREQLRRNTDYLICIMEQADLDPDTE